MPKPGELDSFQTSGGERKRKEEKGGSFGGGGWDEEVMAADDGSDMEGWGDDGWGDFEEKQKYPPLKQKQKSLSPPPPSSGADFFDTFQSNVSSNKPKERDYFSDFGVMAAPSSSSSAKREKSPPPPVSAALFGATGSGEKKVESESGGSGGWGDWGSDFGSTKLQVSAEDRICSFADMGTEGLEINACCMYVSPP